MDIDKLKSTQREGLCGPTAEALSLVTKRQAYEAHLLPMAMEDRRLVCLGCRPLHPDAVRRFMQQVCREIKIIEVSKQELVEGLRNAYGPPEYSEVAELVDAISQPKRVRRNQELVAEPWPASGSMKVIAVTSGKGGVGKTSVTANLCVALAARGYRVGVIDCDFGLSNLHVMLGAKPTYTLTDVMQRKVDLLSAFEKTEGGVYLLAGPTGAAEYADITYAALQQAGSGFSALSNAFDFLFLDTGAGIHEGVLSLLMAADEILLVTTPDPAAILDAYITTRVVLDRRSTAVIKCVVNQAQGDVQAKQIFAKFMSFLNSNSTGRIQYAGKVLADKAAIQGARMRTPYVLSSPHSPAARDIQMLAIKLGGLPEVPLLPANPIARFFSGFSQV